MIENRKSEIDNRQSTIDNPKSTIDNRQSTIMVVDDTPENLNLLRNMLQERGYRVQAFPDGRMALNAAAKNPPDIILLDIMMPEMDGFEVAGHLKADEALQEIPILFISALGEAEDKVKAFAAGGVDYVTKPFQFEEVKARVETHLSLRRMSLELERHNLNLEEKVAERTRMLELANQHLSLLNQDKMKFLRYLSHEMNTPLNWIGGTRIISREALDQTDREMLGFVEKGFERISELVQEVIKYFELAGSDLEPKCMPISISNAVSDLFEERSRKVEDRGIIPEIDVDPQQQVEADPDLFQELLTTLLDNALVYSQPGGVVRITLNRPGEPFRLTVEDNGKGIARENLKKIFQAFALESFDRREKGFGLNLPRARLIAKAHGWYLRAESDGEGKGTRMIVEARQAS